MQVFVWRVQCWRSGKQHKKMLGWGSGYRLEKSQLEKVGREKGARGSLDTHVRQSAAQVVFCTGDGRMMWRSGAFVMDKGEEREAMTFYLKKGSAGVARAPSVSIRVGLQQEQSLWRHPLHCKRVESLLHPDPQTPDSSFKPQLQGTSWSLICPCHTPQYKSYHLSSGRWLESIGLSRGRAELWLRLAKKALRCMLWSDLTDPARFNKA